MNATGRNRVCLAIISAVIAALAVGCAPTEQAGRPPSGPPRTYPNEDAPLTVVLAQYDGPGTERPARELQSRARRVLGSDDVWLELTEDMARVNYGHFRTHRQALDGLAWARIHYQELQAGPYQFCHIYNIPAPDPPAPAEWDMMNTHCVHSLEIGIYYNVLEEDYFARKADAVRAVEALRADGEQAFFLHGENESRVFVGCFPADIFQQGYINGEPAEILNPMVQMFVDRWPRRYENGAEVYRIAHDPRGREIRIPRKPVLVNIGALLREELF